MIKPQGGLVGLVEVLHSLHVVDFLNQPLVLGLRLVQHWGELVRYLAYWQVGVLPPRSRDPRLPRPWPIRRRQFVTLFSRNITGMIIRLTSAASGIPATSTSVIPIRSLPGLLQPMLSAASLIAPC